MQPVVFGGFAVMRSTDFGLKLVVVFYVTTTSRLMPVLVQYSRSFPGYLETCTVVLYSTQAFCTVPVRQCISCLAFVLGTMRTVLAQIARQKKETEPANS